MVFVDIATQPGMGPLRGSMDFLFRDDSLNARNAFQPEKGDEQTQQYTFNLSGTLKEQRTSFSLSAAGASLYDSANLFAQTGAGMRTDSIRRPSDKINFNGRIDHALNFSHTLRANLQQNSNENQNLGVGGYELDDRAYTRATDETIARFSETGPWSRNVFAENRLQVRRQANDSLSAVEAPTIRVLDAFTTGAIPNEKSGSLLTQNPAVLDPEHAGRIVAGSAHNAGQTVSGRLENVDAHRRPGTGHPRSRYEIGGMHAGDRAQRQRSTECEEFQWVCSTRVSRL